MPPSKRTDLVKGANRIIESTRDAEERALEAARKFVDTVNASFPDVSEDGPRQKIIDAAFKMTEQLVGTWMQAAERVVKVAGETLVQPETTKATETAKRAPAKRASAKRAPAKRAS